MLREKKIESVVHAIVEDSKDNKDITILKRKLKQVSEEVCEGDIIKVRGVKAIYVLSYDDIVGMIKNDPVMLERSLKRGKSEKRYRINETRKQPWEGSK